MNNKIKALSEFLNITEDDIKETDYNESEFETSEGDYLVYTNEEADQAWDESIENYIDECVLYELPENYRGYFDREAFKRDCSFDGRGHTLSGYDGVEEYTTIDDVDYYIYRTN